MTSDNHNIESKSDSGFLDKLKGKLDRMLGRKDSEEHITLTLKNENKSAATRRSFRVSVSNMHIVCRNPRVKCKISDICADGVGFISSREFEIGSIIEAVLLWSGKPVLKNVKIKVVRQNKNIVGCCFIDLNKKQDVALSKIVLAAQKKAIKPGSGKKTAKHSAQDFEKKKPIKL
jgi:hypothetical protein